MGDIVIQNDETLEKKSILEPLQKMNLIDDFLFDVTTVDLEACKIIIELSLGVEIKEIRWKEGQRVLHNLPGKRGIRMDFYVEDIEGNIFDVEMQKRNEGNIPKRTRFYQALVDAPLLKSGEKSFDNLNATYIIVICGFDLFGFGRYCYTFKNLCQEMPELELGDGCTKIILNTKGKNDNETEQPLIDFLHYVEQSDDENVPVGCDIRLKRLHEKIKKIKSSELIGVTYMKMEERDRLIKESGMKAGIEEGRKVGIKEGIKEGIRVLIETLQEMGISKEEAHRKAAEKYSIGEEEIEEYISEFWK